jgi:molybdopterin-synthase adenylyltransferase
MEQQLNRLLRQAFLGAESDQILGASRIGIVGLGGGGSHLVQQTAHLGIGRFLLIDPDVIAETNTNRLVGGVVTDIGNTEAESARKVTIASRLIRGINPHADICERPTSWHKATDDLEKCDVILGAVDSFRERDQLERFCRSHFIPYIDIGMDVNALDSKRYLVSGQVFLSLPSRPCLWCCGILTQDRLTEEAAEYGLAGARPQVVWPNGVLASSAVGVLVQLMCGWDAPLSSFIHLDYDGNRGTISENFRMDELSGAVCLHHPIDEAGDPLFDAKLSTQRVAG